MRVIASTAILGIVSFLSGCVPSLSPFYSDADLYFDRNIIGTWAAEDEKESWTFEANGDAGYKMTYLDEHGKIGVFEAKLFRLGNRSFLDLTPVRPAFEQNDYYTGHLLSLHTFVPIAVNGNSAQISYLDHSWLKRVLEKNPQAVGHAVIDDDIILTDSTKNLQAFLKANLYTQGAFENSTNIVRREVRK